MFWAVLIFEGRNFVSVRLKVTKPKIWLWIKRILMEFVNFLKMKFVGFCTCDIFSKYTVTATSSK
jgi:hypothetical protein